MGHLNIMSTEVMVGVESYLILGVILALLSDIPPVLLMPVWYMKELNTCMMQVEVKVLFH